MKITEDDFPEEPRNLYMVIPHEAGVSKKELKIGQEKFFEDPINLGAGGRDD